MAKRIRKQRTSGATRKTKRSRKPTRGKRPYKWRSKHGLIVRAPTRSISDARLQRGLAVLSETKDLGTAARSIRVSVERFKRTAKRRAAIRKIGGAWTVVGRLPRRMPVFCGGRQLAITVNSKSATLIARYMSAVSQFLRTNDPKFLIEFARRSVKDIRGKVHSFETDPNALYRLSSAGAEPFEDIYRIVI